MKKIFNLLSIILLCGLILAACSSATQPQSTEPAVVVSNATEAPTQEAQAAAPAAATAQPEAGSRGPTQRHPRFPPHRGSRKMG